MLIKQKRLSLPRNIALGTSGELLIIVLNKIKSAITPILYLLLYTTSDSCLGVLSSVSNETKLFAKNFSSKSGLNDRDISLPVFPSRTNLKLHNISVTRKMVKKAITNLDLP